MHKDECMTRADLKDAFYTLLLDHSRVKSTLNSNGLENVTNLQVSSTGIHIQ